MEILNQTFKGMKVQVGYVECPADLKKFDAYKYKSDSKINGAVKGINFPTIVYIENFYGSSPVKDLSYPVLEEKCNYFGKSIAILKKDIPVDVFKKLTTWYKNR